MRYQIISRILMVLIGCGLVIAWLLQGTQHRREEDSGPPIPTSGPAVSPPPDHEFSNRALALEAERTLVDQTIWAKELRAEKHEAVFVQLWDQLRSNPDRFAILSRFRFGELILGEWTASQTNELGIVRYSSTGLTRRLNPDAWQQLLAQWQTDGYDLVQSEWRHAAFDSPENGPTRSRFALSWHILNARTHERIIVRGELNIRWKDSTAPDQLPVPEQIDARELEVLRQEGETFFEEVFAKEIPTELNPVFIDPLIAYDLNRDGLSEIILAGQNLVYHNLGQGRFRAGRLCVEPNPLLNTAVIADFTGDGLADLLGAYRYGLLLWPGDSAGRFAGAPRSLRFTTADLPNAFVLTAGDVDRDGDLDVWVAQYKLPYVAGQMPTPYYDANDGFPSFLLLNDGHGGFTDATAESGLAAKRFRRTYSASFIDLDGDTDLDLLVVSDFAGADLYFNDGRGRFTDVTDSHLGETHAFGMAHSFGDYDRDGRLDILMIGMNSFAAQRMDQLRLGPDGFPEHHRWRPEMARGNRLFSGRDQGWAQLPLGDQVARTGWSWGATSFDMDNDGDLEIYIVNGHKSRASAQDYENQFWRHDIYVANATHNPVLDIYFRAVASRLYGAGQSYGGYEKNRLFLNQNGLNFLEVGFLAGVALEADCRNVLAHDLDRDGRVDLVLTTLEVWPQERQTLRIFRNRGGSAGHWISVDLREHGSGYTPVGAVVTLHTPSGNQVRHLVTGDSHRSQHATTAHFGLGDERSVDFIEVRWANGATQQLTRPTIDRYHQLAPELPPSPARPGR